MEQMTIDGATIAWSDTGTGEPTLLIHAGVFGAWFQPVAPHVPGRVIRVVRAGYADGPPPTALVTMAEHAAHAAALLDAPPSSATRRARSSCWSSRRRVRTSCAGWC